MIRLLLNCAQSISSAVKPMNSAALQRKRRLKLLTPQQKHIKIHFNNKGRRATSSCKQFQQTHNLTKLQTMLLFNKKPRLFVPNSLQSQNLAAKLALLDELKTTEPVAALMRKMFFTTKYLTSAMSKEDISNFIAVVKKYGIKDGQVTSMLSVCKNLIHNKFETVLLDKLHILQSYLTISRELSISILAKEPFLLVCSSERLRESLHFFMQKRNTSLNKEAIIKLLSTLGQIFLMGRMALSAVVSWYVRWGLPIEKLWSVLLENPMLFLNYPYDVIPLKIKLFRHFAFTKEMGQVMLEQHPYILICSVRSLEAKLIFVRDRLKLPINMNTLELLAYSFGYTLRPRGDILVKAKIEFNESDILTYFRMTQENFASALKITVARFEEERERYPCTAELDFRRRKVFKNYNSERKLKKYAQRYFNRYQPQVNKQINKKSSEPNDIKGTEPKAGKQAQSKTK